MVIPPVREAELVQPGTWERPGSTPARKINRALHPRATRFIGSENVRHGSAGSQRAATSRVVIAQATFSSELWTSTVPLNSINPTVASKERVRLNGSCSVAAESKRIEQEIETPEAGRLIASRNESEGGSYVDTSHQRGRQKRRPPGRYTSRTIKRSCSSPAPVPPPYPQRR
jgi:hypothetical protein